MTKCEKQEACCPFEIVIDVAQSYTLGKRKHVSFIHKNSGNVSNLPKNDIET